MRARGIVRILKTASPGFQVDQLGYGPVGWAEYSVLDASSVRPLTPLPEGIDMTHDIGTLGLTGMTAYYGLLDIVQATKEDAIVISGASGATGSMAVRIAKHIVKAKRVVGIAGGEEKCRWVVGLGADVCLNYKSPTFSADLAAEAARGFFDVYFDNVGGPLLDTMLGYMAMHGRVALCGAISSYNDTAPSPDTTGAAPGKKPGLHFANYAQIITMRLTLKGFVVHDFASDEARREEFMGAVLGCEGIVSAMKRTTGDGGDGFGDTVVSGSIEDVPRIWLGLFEGKNRGKLITRLAG